MAPQEISVVWLQCGGCTGCTVSLANSAFPSLRKVIVDPIIPGFHISLVYHPTLMAGQGDQVTDVVKALPKGGFVLAVEGSIPENEAFCMLGDGAGKEVSAMKQFLALAEKASLILSVGTCASFGGIPAGAPNPGRYMPVSAIAGKNGVKTPIVNVPGCPPHPNWMTTAIAEFLLAGGVQGMKLDALGRPVSVYGHLIHENCPRRAFFDEGKFAKKPGDPECLFKVGCKGPITYADCPLREWNNGQNWCVKAGAPCQGCTQPEFIDQTTPIYVGLPEDALPKIGERK